VIETVDARTAIGHAPRGIGSWHYSRSATGVVTYRHPAAPAGVSLCTYSRTPQGDHRLRVEGNLTTALHGEGAAALSLHPDELTSAVDAFRGLAASLVGEEVPEAGAWDLHRLDPSKTVDAGVGVGDWLDAAGRSWGRLRTARQAVVRYQGDGCSVRWQHAKWRSWEVYDKTAEVAARGGECRAGLLRMEARIRPRKGSGDWKRALPTLALDAETRRLVMGELDSLADSVVSKAAAVGAGGVMLALVEAGVPPNTAVRLAGFLVVGDQLGPAFFTERLGIPAKTVERWRAEVRKALGSEASEARMAGIFKTVSGDMLATELPEVFARDEAKS
jgi:hypothetical protein